MYTIVKYSTGRRTEALILNSSYDSMRIVVPRRNDTFSLVLNDGQWYSEEGEVIEFETLLAAQGEQHRDCVPRTRAAGS